MMESFLMFRSLLSSPATAVLDSWGPRCAHAQRWYPASVSGDRTAIKATGDGCPWEGGRRRRPASQETCHQSWSRASALGGVSQGDDRPVSQVTGCRTIVVRGDGP